MKNQVTYTISWSRDNQEYHVRFRLDGIRQPDWDYFTNDERDAKATADDIVKEYALYIAKEPMGSRL